MKIVFHIHYYTRYGEDLVVTRVDDNLSEIARYRMYTSDGEHWQVEVDDKRLTAGTVLTYFYSVERYGVGTVRREWAQMPHRLTLTGQRTAAWEVYDQWTDIPTDAYLYSSAFTECLNRRERQREKAVRCQRLLRLKVRAPQLSSDQQLALVGSADVLGKWDTEHSLPMVEMQPGEWMADVDAQTIAGQTVEFKFIVTKNDNDVLWEEGGNRRLSVPFMPQGGVAIFELPTARFAISERRVAGTLVPVFSLRSEGSFGVGDFGDLKKMIDFVALTGQRVLQILPINDTTTTHTWTDSYPYSCISIFALHPQYVDLRQLPPLADKAEREKFEKLRGQLNRLDKIDYEEVNNAKDEYLRRLFEQEGRGVMASKDFRQFFGENEQWLVPYAQYCSLRDKYGTGNFTEWPDHRTWADDDRVALSNPRTKAYREVAFYYFVQYVLARQMSEAHEYARSKHVVLKGDIPIGVARYGCDVWMEPKYFNMNGQAGAPPDDFSADGQNWGFPTYNWDEMLKDGCQWWVRRFQNMQKYFDAYRIDHVLGFFRIWEIPVPQTSGMYGQFQPSLPLSRREIEERGVEFDDNENGNGNEGRRAGELPLFLEDHKQRGMWHPAIGALKSERYRTMPDWKKANFYKLYEDYFYHRNNQFWYEEAMKKLPRLVDATRMLVCAEDLGMVPACVEWVMNELRILSLEIQSMPKDPHLRFGRVERNPYRSVATISSHDMPTLRQWWDEDEERTQDYYRNVLGYGGAAPHPLSGGLAKDILMQHLVCPSMLCIISIQDWMAIDEKLRLADKDAERINIPANPRHYWRYRMHVSIEDLMANDDFRNEVTTMVKGSGR